jgi:putative addiction module component (TIGR02574 family)
MSANLDDLTAQAMALSPQQRCELAERLWLSVEGQIDEDEALFAEIARRDAEMESGTVKMYSHEEVMRKAREALGE